MHDGRNPTWPQSREGRWLRSRALMVPCVAVVILLSGEICTP